MTLFDEYTKYLNNCTTPYHVVKETIHILESKGFKRTSFEHLHSIQPGMYYIHAFNTLLISVIIPEHPCSMRIVATHNDSPVLKLKPHFLDSSENMQIVRLCPYGGGLWHTWFDRPLGISGMVILKDGSKVLVNRLFDVIIPSLPPHLDNNKVYNGGFIFDKEQTLNGLVCSGKKVEDMVFSGSLLCKDGQNVSFRLDDIVAHNLSLYEQTEAKILGDHLVVSARQDNLLSTFTGLKALDVDSSNIKVLAVFDFEETGSMQLDGARCLFFRDVVRCLQKKLNDHKRSIIISLDVAHAFNFNFSDFYEKKHRVLFGKGIVIKHSRAYATDTDGVAFIKKLSNYKCQEFCLKNNIRGGGTIGTMLSTLLGMRCVDLGTPLMSMHSICETSHCEDITDTIEVLSNFYKA